MPSLTTLPAGVHGMHAQVGMGTSQIQHDMVTQDGYARVVSGG